MPNPNCCDSQRRRSIFWYNSRELEVFHRTACSHALGKYLISICVKWQMKWWHDRFYSRLKLNSAYLIPCICWLLWSTQGASPLIRPVAPIEPSRRLPCTSALLPRFQLLSCVHAFVRAVPNVAVGRQWLQVNSLEKLFRQWMQWHTLHICVKAVAHETHWW